MPLMSITRHGLAETVLVGRTRRARKLSGQRRAIPLLAALPLLSGCVQYSYDRLRIGQEQREYRLAFPEEKIRPTAAGFCFMEQGSLGRTDAVGVLLTRDRRIAGKLHAAHLERNLGLGPEVGYRLHAELDPRLLDTAGAGPIDALRVVADDLTVRGEDTFVRTAHGWVAAGLVRIIQQWPHVGDEGPAITRLTDALARVPAGGEARISVDPRGVYQIEYLQGKTP